MTFVLFTTSCEFPRPFLTFHREPDVLGLATGGAPNDQETARLQRPQTMANMAFVTCQSPYQLLVTTRGHAPCPLVICRQPGEESLLQSGKAVGCHPPPCLARRRRENRNAIYTFGKPYARRGMVLPGKFVRVLKMEGKCSYLRAKAVHISGHLPGLRGQREHRADHRHSFTHDKVHTHVQHHRQERACCSST